MNNHRENHHLERTDQAKQAAKVLAALLVGGLVGAGTMMLYAPRSGKETRSKLQDRTLHLRDQTVGGVKNAVKQVSSRTHDLTEDVKDRADDLQHQGRQAIADQLDRVAAAAKAGRKAIR
ncbi:MAG: YtxH domain-containing protein [Bacteroidota bacterium]